MDYKELIKCCKKGENKAQEMLYKKLATPMYKVCLRYFENEFDAEDVLINGLYKFFHNLEKFDFRDERRLFGNFCSK